MSTPEQKRARHKLNYAVKKGRIIRPETCERCGARPGRAANGKHLIDGHHHNGYDEAHWYDVEWLCQTCHQVVEPRRLGMPHSDEDKAKISRGMQKAVAEGRFVSAMTGMNGELNPFYGKTHTEESRAKMSESRKRLWSEGKLSGQPHTDEGRTHISEGTKRAYASGKFHVTCPICKRTTTKSWLYRHGCEVPRES